MVNALEIRQKLSLVDMGLLSLNRFEDWFIPRSWNIHRYGSPDTIELVSSIRCLFSERDDHALNESELRDELSQLLGNTRYLSVRISLPASRPEFFSFHAQALKPAIVARLVV
jgi:hypothetical protein